ncbi:MAG: CoA transferase [Brucellaceae bacterium]|nr:CoA transferase [Brucellaceae bacterium]
MRPLDDILVVSIEQAIAAPYCTRLMADQGARVIKVERPDGGDFARGYDTRARGLSSHFVWTNRSKESLTLDLKDEQGLAALRTILKSADVFVQNLAPGAAARLGLEGNALREDNPKLITCSISGYGAGGPDEARKAYDLLVQAEAGFLSVTGTAGEMAKAGISVVDIAAGVSAYQAILAALLMRHKTGKGDDIEISMLEAMAEWMGFPLYYAIDGQQPPQRSGASHATICPYGPFSTADGSVFLGIQNEREWRLFARDVMGDEGLAGDPRFSSNEARTRNRAELEPLINEALAKLTTEQALELLDRAGIGTARVNDMAGLWNHPQLAARNRWAEFNSPQGLLPALRPVTGASWQPRLDPVPALGEHTNAILAEFGIPQAAGKAG